MVEVAVTPFEIMRQIILSNAGCVAQVGTRVYAAGLEDDMAGLAASKAINIITDEGGTPHNDLSWLDGVPFQIDCYGADVVGAWEVYGALRLLHPTRNLRIAVSVGTAWVGALLMTTYGFDDIQGQSEWARVISRWYMHSWRQTHELS